MLPSLSATERDVKVILDREGRGPWPTARRAWEALAEGLHDWGIVIQDDVTLCRRFPDVAAEALSAVEAAIGAAPVSFYCPRAIVRVARAAGVSWIWSRDGAWGVAMALPRALIVPFLDWVEDHVRPEFPHDDTRLALWARAHDLPILDSVPSLVDHAGIGVQSGAGRSVMRHYDPRRVATWYDPAPSGVDWYQGLLGLRVQDTTDATPRHRGRWERTDRPLREGA